MNLPFLHSRSVYCNASDCGCRSTRALGETGWDDGISGSIHSGIGKERNDRPVGPLCMGQGMCVDKKLDRQGIPAGPDFY